jgi:formylglycine-generating enzyme required for sulfatase activity
VKPLRAPTVNAAVGLAELARLLATFHEDDVAKMCTHIGFVAPSKNYAEHKEKSVKDDASGRRENTERDTSDARSDVRVPELAETAPTLLWRMEEATWRDEPTQHRVQRREVVETFSERERKGDGRSFFATPRAPLLMRWPRLWPVLQRAFQKGRASQVIDVAVIVHKWTRGERMTRVPMVVRRQWASRAALWIDRSHRLTPFWNDQEDVRARLVRALGRLNIAVRYFEQAPEREEMRGVDPRVPVVMLGDLGAFGSANTKGAWQRAGRALQRAGVRATALVVGKTTAGKSWHIERWELTQHTQVGTAEQRADALLALTAPAAFVHVGLLRALRMLLPVGHADASTEVDVWAHRDVRAADVTGLVLEPDALVRRREEFVTRVEEGLRLRAVEVVAQWHRSGRKELLYAEALACDAMGVSQGVFTRDEREDARAFAVKVAGLMDARSGRVVPGWLREFGRRWLGGMPDGVYERVPQLAEAWRTVFRGVKEARVPRGVDAVGEGTVGETFVALRQVGGKLHMERVESSAWPSPAGRAGSPLACMRVSDETMVVTVGKGGTRRQYTVGDAVVLPEGHGAEVCVESDRGGVVLRARGPEAWAHMMGRDRYGLWAEVLTEGVKWRMRWVPPGRFVMGSPEEEAGRRGNEGPQHEVTLTKGYWVGETPVTQALWEAVMGNNPSMFKSADRPVETVNWNSCIAFMQALGEGMRLLTEAEWEHACRAGTTTATWVGDLEILGLNNAPVLDPIAWYGGNSGREFDLKNGWDANWDQKQYPEDTVAGTRRVGKKQCNPLGLHDMLGNVWEWCSDRTGPYASEAVEDPSGATGGSLRIMRGGSWGYHARDVRAAYRRAIVPGNQYANFGFRLARGH